jgi:hypothetical protein
MAFNSQEGQSGSDVQPLQHPKIKNGHINSIKYFLLFWLPNPSYIPDQDVLPLEMMRRTDSFE